MYMKLDRLNNIVTLAKQADEFRIKSLRQSDRRLLILACEILQKPEEMDKQKDEHRFEILENKLLYANQYKPSNCITAFFKFLGNLFHLRVASHDLRQKIGFTYENFVKKEIENNLPEVQDVQPNKQQVPQPLKQKEAGHVILEQQQGNKEGVKNNLPEAKNDKKEKVNDEVHPNKQQIPQPLKQKEAGHVVLEQQQGNKEDVKNNLPEVQNYKKANDERHPEKQRVLQPLRQKKADDVALEPQRRNEEINADIERNNNAAVEFEARYQNCKDKFNNMQQELIASGIDEKTIEHIQNIINGFYKLGKERQAIVHTYQEQKESPNIVIKYIEFVTGLVMNPPQDNLHKMQHSPEAFFKTFEDADRAHKLIQFFQEGFNKNDLGQFEGHNVPSFDKAYDRFQDFAKRNLVGEHKFEW